MSIAYKVIITISLTLIAVNLFFDINVNTFLNYTNIDAKWNQGTQYFGDVTNNIQQVGKYDKIYTLFNNADEPKENIKFLTPDGKEGFIDFFPQKQYFQVALCTQDLKECKIFEQYNIPNPPNISCTYVGESNPSDTCW